MKQYSKLVLFLVFTTSAIFVSSDDTVPVLAKNPFNQPTLVSRGALTAEANSRSQFNQTLIATLVSGKSSMANIDGNLISVGEVYNGFLLVSVGEGTATFRKDDVTVTLNVGEKDSDDED